MAILFAIALVDPPVAHWLTLEDGVVEWLQVLLNAAAALARHMIRTPDGRVSPFDVLTAAVLTGLIIGELVASIGIAVAAAARR